MQQHTKNLRLMYKSLHSLSPEIMAWNHLPGGIKESPTLRSFDRGLEGIASVIDFIIQSKRFDGPLF